MPAYSVLSTAISRSATLTICREYCDAVIFSGARTDDLYTATDRKFPT